MILERFENGSKLRTTAILVLGYSRPEFVVDRLTELQKSPEVQVIVSIDNFADSHKDLRASWLSLEKMFPQVKWWFRESHLGIAKNLFDSVTQVFDLYDNCIIIEDDVSTHLSSVSSLVRILEKRLPKEILTVGLFGGLPSTKILDLVLKNRWRKTRYFSAWGWAIQREDWSLFSLYLVHDLKEVVNDVIKLRMGKRRLHIWSRRFSTVVDNPLKTWDYQLFFYSLLLNKQHLLPIFRLSENLGFNDARATNTRSGKPSWYFGKINQENSISDSVLTNRIFQRVLQLVDSFTWVSDSPTIQEIRSKKNMLGR